MKNNAFLSVLFTFLLAIVLVVSGCKSGTKATPYTPISGELSPNGSASRVSEFQDKAQLSLNGATFLALTRLQVSSTEKDVYKFTATLPTNTPAYITVQLIPDQKYKPTPAELSAASAGQAMKASLTHSLVGTTYNFKLEYFLPKTLFALSSELMLPPAISQLTLTQGSGILSNQPAVFRKSSQIPAVLQVADGGEQSGIMVSLVVTLTQAGKEFVSAVQDAGIKGAFGVEGNPLGAAQSSALDVVEAFNTSADYQDLVTQLDQLQAQAENPVNPLTQQAYAENPAVRQNILNEIDAARSDLQSMTGAQFFNQEIAVGAGLLGLPALSIAIAPIVDWNNRTLRDLMRERVNNIRNMITTGTGSMAPHTVPSGTVDTVTIGSTDVATLSPGTWLARWEGSTTEVFTGLGTTTTITDRGTMTFKVNADSTVTGTATGHYSYHLTTPFAVTDGQTDYTFPVGGMMIGGQLSVGMGGLPVPMTFPVIWTPVDGKPETSVWLVGPMIPQGLIKLKGGETLDEHEDRTADGIHITQTRKLTIG
jgi:hypothetical protein